MNFDEFLKFFSLSQIHHRIDLMFSAIDVHFMYAHNVSMWKSPSSAKFVQMLQSDQNSGHQIYFTRIMLSSSDFVFVILTAYSFPVCVHLQRFTIPEQPSPSVSNTSYSSEKLLFMKYSELMFRLLISSLNIPENLALEKFTWNVRWSLN